MRKKGYAALAAAVLTAALNMGSLQAAEEAASLDGESVSYDMATGVITAEGDVLLKHGETRVAGAKASYNTKTQQGEITGGVVAVRDDMRLTANTVTLESADAIHATGGAAVTINFTPHLAPISRGILATCYATLREGVTPEQVDEAFGAMYADEFFIRLRGRGAYPATKYVRGTNYCDLAWHIDPRTRRVIVFSAIDNLVKGAAGQAVQNMNIAFGLDERAGLDLVPMYP